MLLGHRLTHETPYGDLWSHIARLARSTAEVDVPLQRTELLGALRRRGGQDDVGV